jgi:quinol monooxygenase YgiN
VADRRTVLRAGSVAAIGAVTLGSMAPGAAQAATGATLSDPEGRQRHRGGCKKTVGFGFQAIMTARPGKRDRVITLLLAAPALPHPDCVVFLVGRSTEDNDTVYVTEGWTGRDEHARFFASPQAQKFVARLQPLLTGESQTLDQLPVGGKPAF